MCAKRRLNTLIRSMRVKFSSAIPQILQLGCYKINVIFFWLNLCPCVLPAVQCSEYTKNFLKNFNVCLSQSFMLLFGFLPQFLHHRDINRIFSVSLSSTFKTAIKVTLMITRVVAHQHWVDLLAAKITVNSSLRFERLAWENRDPFWLDPSIFP